MAYSLTNTNKMAVLTKMFEDFYEQFQVACQNMQTMRLINREMPVFGKNFHFRIKGNEIIEDDSLTKEQLLEIADKLI